jgi:hypothetical protein
MDRRAAAKFNLDAIKTLEAFAGKARQSRLKGGRVVGPSLYTPQHHHGYRGKAEQHFRP